MPQTQVLMLWCLAPYMLLITPALALTLWRYRRPWLILVLLSPFCAWLVTALVVDRPTTLANLSFEPRLMAGVVNMCIASELAELKTKPAFPGRILISALVCSVFAVWLGAFFPEMPE